MVGGMVSVLGMVSLLRFTMMESVHGRKMEKHLLKAQSLLEHGNLYDLETICLLQSIQMVNVHTLQRKVLH